MELYISIMLEKYSTNIYSKLIKLSINYLRRFEITEKNKKTMHTKCAIVSNVLINAIINHDKLVVRKTV